jgi:signal transduction histidine kinase
VRRLYTRIYWHFILVLVMVAGVMSFLFTTGFRAAVLREYSEKLAAHTSMLLAPMWSDPRARERMVRHLSEELDLDLTVRETDGRLILAVGPELPAPSGGDLDAALSGPHHVKRPYGHGWYVSAPVRELGTRRVVGLLETTRARHFGSMSLVRPAITVAIVLGLIALGTAPLARRISRPVERLTEASRRLGGGELSYRVPQPWRRWPPWARRRGRKRRDELAELTGAWNEMAERIEKLVRGHRELLANVSHELRSPLQRIRLALELLPSELAPEVRARLGDVEVDLAELERLIDDVLTTSRLEATGLPMHLGRVGVREMMEQLAERAAHDPVTQGKSVAVDGVTAELELSADGPLLKRALWNLVENAAKYGAPPIRLAAERRGDRVLLSVTDEGPGIAPADRERVLEPFYRADKARTPGTGGFGLGLTLARRVAEVHGGRIVVAPAHDPTGGCRVTLDIPART